MDRPGRAAAARLHCRIYAGRAGGAGQGGAGGGAARFARRLGAVAGPARSGRPARGAGADARAGAGADPLRAHARLAVHVLPRRRRPDGRRPRRRAADRAEVQLCGDAHLSNFGAFAAPDRRLDLQRQRLRRDAARAVRVGRQAARGELRGRRARPRLRRAPARARSTARSARAYREAMREFAEMRKLELWYARIDVEDIADAGPAQAHAEAVKRFERNVAKARAKDSLRAFGEAHRDRRRRAADRQRPAADRPDRGARRRRTADGSSTRRSAGSIRSYRRTLQRRPPPACSSASATSHAARKVVGVGSVGTRAWIVLMLGRDDDDPLFLQVKEAEAVGARALPRQERVRQPRPARRRGPAADAGRQRHHARLDPRDGLDGVERDFYIRQLWDGKGSALVEADGPDGADGLRAALRLDAREGARPLGRRGRDRRLPRLGRRLRPRDGRRSPRPTPTRTSATTARCGTRWSPAASPPKPGRDLGDRVRREHRWAQPACAAPADRRLAAALSAQVAAADAVAGLSVWALLVPQSLAYATLVGVPVQYGLYTAFAALMRYPIFGTSRHLVEGPSATRRRGLRGRDRAAGRAPRRWAPSAAVAYAAALALATARSTSRSACCAWAGSRRSCPRR